MDSKTIHSLLDKYWEGATSLKEEAQLRTYFNRSDVPEELESFKPLFQFFKQEQAVSLNEDFDKRLSSNLEVSDTPKARILSIRSYIARAAAIAAVFIGILYFLNTNILSNESKGLTDIELTAQEKYEAKLAYAEAKAALLLISKKLNKSTSKAEEGITRVRSATKIIKN